MAAPAGAIALDDDDGADGHEPPLIDLTRDEHDGGRGEGAVLRRPSRAPRPFGAPQIALASAALLLTAAAATYIVWGHGVTVEVSQ